MTRPCPPRQWANRFAISQVWCNSFEKLAECRIVAARRGFSGELAALVKGLGAEIDPVDGLTAVEVADAYAVWGKGIHPAGLNFGDSFAYACAKRSGAPLRFVGNDFSKTDIAVVMAQVERLCGKDQLRTSGLSVRSTLDPKLQIMARQALAKGLLKFDRAHGWRGAIKRLDLAGNWQEELAGMKPLTDMRTMANRQGNAADTLSAGGTKKRVPDNGFGFVSEEAAFATRRGCKQRGNDRKAKLSRGTRAL